MRRGTRRRARLLVQEGTAGWGRATGRKCNPLVGTAFDAASRQDKVLDEDSLLESAAEAVLWTALRPKDGTRP